MLLNIFYLFVILFFIFQAVGSVDDWNDLQLNLKINFFFLETFINIKKKFKGNIFIKL